MKRPGKAVFDAGMMAGWAFVAVLTCLLALTVIDESTDPSQRSDVVVAVGSDDARLITGSVDPDEPGTASIRPDQNRALLDSQKQSFDPFAGNDEQQAQMRQLLKELRSLQREVEAFHVSTTRLRQENDQLRLLLQNLELADSRTAQTPSDAGAGSNKRKDGELIILSKENLQTKKKIRVVGPGAGNPFMNLEPADRSDKSVSLEPRVTDKVVDPIATGSIPAPENPQTISSNRNEFDPFEATNQSNVKLTVKPLDMDVAIQTEDGKMLLPRSKPVPIDLADDGRALKPQSEIVAAPGEISRTTQTAFGLDLGQFRSLAELTSAWKDVSVTQKGLVGDLSPLTFVSQSEDKQLRINLLAGPIQNAAQAAVLCVNLQAKGYGCRVTSYQGQALALR